MHQGDPARPQHLLKHQEVPPVLDHRQFLNSSLHLHLGALPDLEPVQRRHADLDQPYHGLFRFFGSSY